MTGSLCELRERYPLGEWVEGDGDIFLADVDQVLVPRLEPGQVVVLDNLAAHKVAGVRGRIEAAGAQLLYLPPYSPDCNPMEK